MNTSAFEALERAGVETCIWRGSPRLDRAWAGLSDFDLLVAPAGLPELATALHAVNYKRALTAPQRTAPGLEDWLGLAGPSGPLLHLHVHERMLVGEPRLFRFRLPFEREVLDRRRRLDGGPVWVADPVDEAALLLIRAALQLRWREQLPANPTAKLLVGKVAHDLSHLLGEASPQVTVARDLVIERVRGWLGDDRATSELAELPEITLSGLRALAETARRALAEHTDQSSSAAALEGLRRGFAAGARKLARGGHGPLPPASRSGPRGGRTLALVGPADTVGRLERELRSLLSAKLDVVGIPAKGSLGKRLEHGMRARHQGWIALLTASPEEAPELVGATAVDGVLLVSAAELDAAAQWPADWTCADTALAPDQLSECATAFAWAQV